MGSPQVGFFFRVEPPTILYIICLVSVLVSAFYFQVLCWMPYPPLGLNHWGVHQCNTLEFTCGRHVQPGDVHQPTQGIHRVAASSTTLNREEHYAAPCCSPAIPSIWWGIQLWGLGRESPNPSAFPTWCPSFPCLVPSNDTVNSEAVMGIKPGDSRLVIGYQVDEFTHTWSSEQLVAHSHLSWVHW